MRVEFEPRRSVAATLALLLVGVLEPAMAAANSSDEVMVAGLCNPLQKACREAALQATKGWAEESWEGIKAPFVAAKDGAVDLWNKLGTAAVEAQTMLTVTVLGLGSGGDPPKPNQNQVNDCNKAGGAIVTPPPPELPFCYMPEKVPVVTPVPQQSNPPQPNSPPPSSPCPSGQVLIDSQCWANRAEYDEYKCSLRDDSVWSSGRCITYQAYCKTIKAAYDADNHACVGAAEAAVMCEEIGFLWVESRQKCFVVSNANIPRGLEQFFYVAATAQEKALLEQYNLKLTELVYRARSESDAAYQVEIANVNARWDEEFVQLEAELVKEVDSLSEDYERSLEEYRQDVMDMQRFSQLIEERIRASYYAGTVQPSNSLGIMRTTYEGVQYKDVRVEFPKGIPTPAASGSSWVVNIPATITFPEVDYEGVQVTFIGGALHYAFSIDGGKNFQRGEVPVDFTTNGNEAQKVTLYVRASFAQASGNYDLVLMADLVFTEEYRFEGGLEYALEDMVRRGPELRRTFYTSANPFATANSVVQDVDVIETVDGVTGNVPGGMAGTLNWLAQTTSETTSKAQGIDAATGLGLQHVVKAAPYAIGGGVLAVGYVKGFLDFLPFIGKFRAKRLAAKAAKKGLGLNLDFDLDL